MTETSPPRPFDERAALQELERLAEKIQSTRRQRQQAVAEFESFVKTFREDRYEELMAAQRAQASPPPPADPRKTDVRPAPVVASAPAPRAAEAPAPARQEADVKPPAIVRVPVERTSAVSRSLLKIPAVPRARLAVAGLGLGLLTVVLIVTWLWSGSRSPSTVQSETPAPASRAEPPAPGASPQPVASTGPARALNIELVTLRPVWTRVIADDQKVIERELPKDSRIPVSADRAIAIRAGDAGAIRLTVNGKDLGVLGRDGQIASRTLTAPPARAK